MPLGRLATPFDHPDWIFEIKYDGFRALACIDGDCRLVSRNGNVYKSFPTLAADLARAVPRPAILDAEIVCLDAEGKPQFYDLCRRRGEHYFYAFDALWFERRDLRSLPLIERKRVLRAIVPETGSRLLYASHMRRDGVRLFEAACRMDLEGIVAKLASGASTPEATTWVKVKNASYSQVEGRRELFEGRRAKGRA